MALALNTAHPLYANLISLIAVDDDNVIKELVGAATMTPNGAVTMGAGTYGRHFQTSISGGNALGVARSAIVSMGTPAIPNCSVFVAANDFLQGSATSRSVLLSETGNQGNTMLAPVVTSAGLVSATAGTANGSTFTTGNVSSGAHSVCVTRTGQASSVRMIDGDAEVVPGGQVGSTSASNGWSYIGGHPSGSFGGCPAQFVYVASFDKALSSAEAKDLHDSLTGANAFALVLTNTDLTGSITLADLETSGSLASNVALLTGDLSIADVLASGALGLVPGSIRTLPFARNNGTRPTGLINVAVAVLSDDASLLRLAGSTAIAQNGDGTISFSGAGLPGVGASVIVITREPDGKIGAERYLVT
jgi:hypothetical protein